jgi:hypothetical protein
VERRNPQPAIRARQENRNRQEETTSSDETTSSTRRNDKQHKKKRQAAMLETAQRKLEKKDEDNLQPCANRALSEVASNSQRHRTPRLSFRSMIQVAGFGPPPLAYNLFSYQELGVIRQ